MILICKGIGTSIGAYDVKEQQIPTFTSVTSLLPPGSVLLSLSTTTHPLVCLLSIPSLPLCV
jgi:hypothetical protein